MLYGTFINISEIQHILKRMVAVSVLKILCKNLYSVKCYDKQTLSLCEKFSWGLTYFDQFMFNSDATIIPMKGCTHFHHTPDTKTTPTLTLRLLGSPNVDNVIF